MGTITSLGAPDPGEPIRKLIEQMHRQRQAMFRVSDMVQRWQQQSRWIEQTHISLFPTLPNLQGMLGSPAMRSALQQVAVSPAAQALTWQAERQQFLSSLSLLGQLNLPSLPPPLLQGAMEVLEEIDESTAQQVQRAEPVDLPDTDVERIQALVAATAHTPAVTGMPRAKARKLVVYLAAAIAFSSWLQISIEHPVVQQVTGMVGVDALGVSLVAGKLAGKKWDALFPPGEDEEGSS